MTLTRILTTLLICLAGLANNAHATCMPYEPETTTLTGKLVRKTFAGAPNFESIANGDQPETGFYLVLSAPICAIGSPNTSNSETQQGVRLVQLVLNQQGYAQLRPWLGKNIRVRGKLFAWQTGHHHTPLLLSFEQIAPQ